MAVTDRQILPLTDPIILVDPMEMEDFESDGDGDTSDLADPPADKATEDQGRNMPRIQINTAIIKPDELDYFSLKMSEFLPTLRISINDKEGRFGNIDYPKDGDIVSVYIRPEDVQKLKEIRIDFDIRSIKFVAGGDGSADSFSIRAVMKVPNIYAEDCEALPSDTTFNHLNTVATSLGLGYASNEDSTDDAMVRIRPYDTNLRFIKDLTTQAYKNDDSFWTSYIDLYYYMCFVNVNKQFSLADELEPGVVANNTSPNRSAGTEGKDEGKVYTIILSNDENQKGTNMSIKSYGLMNKSGDTWIDNGYKRYVQYYDQFSEEWIENFVDPLTTEGSEEEFILPKGRADEMLYKTQVKYKFLGKQLSGGGLDAGYNVHENYIFAHILNYQNLEEIKKMSLSIELEMVNFNLYRYQRVPISIYESRETNKILIGNRDGELGESEGNDKELEEGNATNVGGGQIKNEFLSGFYIIDEIEYIYTGVGSSITQKINCLRREWPIPNENQNY